MIKISSISLKNFLSIGNQTQSIKLDKDYLTLILGENLDITDATNGVGKTCIFQALIYGFYGKPLTKIKIPNLINNINQKGMSVLVSFTKDNIEYRIERGQKPAFLKFYINDKEQENIEETDEALGENKYTQEEINRILGMSYDMFKHIVAMNTFTTPFLRMSVADQRMVIEELLGITLISKRADYLKKIISDTKDNIRSEGSMIKATIEANSRIQSAIDQAMRSSKNWDTLHFKKIKDFQIEINQLNAIDFNKEISLFDLLDDFNIKEKNLNAELNILRKDLIRFKSELKNINDKVILEASDLTIDKQIIRMRDEETRKNNDINRHIKTIKELKIELNKFEIQLISDDQICSNCNQSLIGTDHLELVRSNIKKSILDITSKILFQEKEIETKKLELIHINNDIDILNKNLEDNKKSFELKLEVLEIEKINISNKIIDINDEIYKIENELKSFVKPDLLFSSRDELYQSKQVFDNIIRDLENEKNTINPYFNQVEGLISTLQVIDKTILENLENNLKHQEFLLKLLVSKDSFIRKKIIDQNLHYLNLRLNFYLEKLGLPHEVVFLSDLSVDITKLGRDMDFEQLSRGEMNRISMSISWAFRDIWESLNTNLNLLAVDEMLDQGTDSIGVHAAMSILKDMARDRKKNVFLITHRSELISSADTILVVTKENDFTNFKERE